MRTNVYVDGFNLFYGCLKGTPHKWLDPLALCVRLLPGHEIVRVRYFTALITPRADDPKSRSRQDTYLRALRTLPGLEIHLGHFLVSRTRMPLARPLTDSPRTVEVIKTEEKGSDVNIATHMLADAFRADAEAFVLITNDSDLAEPIRVVTHDLGGVVGLLNPHPRPSHALLRCNPNFVKKIRSGALAASQFPDSLHDARGGFTKPSEW